MNRAIPTVRKWRVTLRDAQRRVLARAVVDAPTKQFARWTARASMGWGPWWAAHSVTVSAVRHEA